MAISIFFPTNRKFMDKKELSFQKGEVSLYGNFRSIRSLERVTSRSPLWDFLLLAPKETEFYFSEITCDITFEKKVPVVSL